MGGRGLAGLLLVTLLVMPGAGAELCGQGHYLHEGRCCLSCPAGTYVAQHCSVPHSRGRCAPCTEGESYTAHENGLEACLLCQHCKDDQVTLRPCTLVHDTECQCQQGYFCPIEGCEICQRCSTTCPEGKEIVQNCNANMDIGCGLPNRENTALVCIIVGLLFSGGLLLFCVIRRLKSDKGASTDRGAGKGLKHEDSTRGLLTELEIPANNPASPEDVNSSESPGGQVQTNTTLEVTTTIPEENSVVPSEQNTVLHEGWKHCTGRCWRRIVESLLSAKTGQCPAFSLSKVQPPRYRIIVKDLSQKEVRDTFWTFMNVVPPKKWEQLMRTQLQENEIVKIIYNFPNNREEQAYQMLLTCKNTLGEKQTIIKLLNELWYLDIKAYDNVLNTLKSNNIVSKLEATDC